MLTSKPRYKIKNHANKSYYQLTFIQDVKKLSGMEWDPDKNSKNVGIKEFVFDFGKEGRSTRKGALSLVVNKASTKPSSGPDISQEICSACLKK